MNEGFQIFDRASGPRHDPHSWQPGGPIFAKSSREIRRWREEKGAICPHCQSMRAVWWGRETLKCRNCERTFYEVGFLAWLIRD